MSKQARNKAEAMAPVLTDTADIEGAVSWGMGMQSRRNRNREITYRPDVCTVKLDSCIHVILPVWLGAYRYRGKSYSFAVNGQTGEVGGEAPRSRRMVALTVGYIAVGLAAVALVLMLLWPALRSFFTSPGATPPPAAPQPTSAIQPRVPIVPDLNHLPFNPYVVGGFVLAVLFALIRALGFTGGTPWGPRNRR
jgi:hypothetical protein